MYAKTCSTAGRMLRSGLVCAALAAAAAPAAHAGLIYDFSFFDIGNNVVGNGTLALTQEVLDAGIDLNGVMLSGPYPPAGSHFVRITDLTSLSFEIFGHLLTQDDLAPSLVGPDGVVFAADGTFLQFIDPSLGVVDLSATDVVFGTPGRRVIFDENHPSGFEVELAGAQDCVRQAPGTPGGYACQFSVSRRAEVAEPGSLALVLAALAALAGLVGSARRTRSTPPRSSLPEW